MRAEVAGIAESLHIVSTNLHIKGEWSQTEICSKSESKASSSFLLIENKWVAKTPFNDL